MMNWLNERLRGWCTRGEAVEVERAELGLGDPGEIEGEDLAGYLIRMARQPGRSAVTVCFVGREPTADDLRPRPGTWEVRWWN